MNYVVKFTGFKTKKAAKKFAEWFECQGEQSIDYYWDIHMDGEPGPKVQSIESVTKDVIVKIK